jgi:hypothetical protein
VVEVFVDVAQEPVADERVDQDGREQDGERYREPGEQGEAAA